MVDTRRLPKWITRVRLLYIIIICLWNTSDTSVRQNNNKKKKRKKKLDKKKYVPINLYPSGIHTFWYTLLTPFTYFYWMRINHHWLCPSLYCTRAGRVHCSYIMQLIYDRLSVYGFVLYFVFFSCRKTITDGVRVSEWVSPPQYTKTRAGKYVTYEPREEMLDRGCYFGNVQ